MKIFASKRKFRISLKYFLRQKMQVTFDGHFSGERLLPILGKLKARGNRWAAPFRAAICLLLVLETNLDA